MRTNSLYKDVVERTAVYLGPAADRFITRQIVGHLDKAPEKLMPADLDEIIKWIKPAISLLTDSPESVDKYIDALKQLAMQARKAT